MNKITEVLILNKKLKLEELNFLQIKNKDGQVWNEYPYSHEQGLLQGGCYPKKEYDWPQVEKLWLKMAKVWEERK